MLFIFLIICYCIKLEEELTMKIQWENNMLMEKISRIMRTTGGVDNRNYYDKKRLVEIVAEPLIWTLSQATNSTAKKWGGP